RGSATNRSPRIDAARNQLSKMNTSAPTSQVSTSAAEPSKSSGLFLGVLLFKLRALIALFVLIGIFSVLSNSFFTEENLIILVGQTAITAIMAVGMTFVILTGGI